MSRLLHYTLRLGLPKRCQRSVQVVYEFDGRRRRERQAMGDLDHVLLALCWRFICFFEREPERSKYKSHGATIEDRAEKLVSVSLDDGGLS